MSTKGNWGRSAAMAKKWASATSRTIGVVALTSLVLLLSQVMAGSRQASECETDPSLFSADCNGDRSLTIGDPVYLLNYMFTGGPAPHCSASGPNAEIEVLNKRLDDLTSRLDQLGAVEDLAQYLTISTDTINGLDGPHVMFTGANVHIRSGGGTTSEINGKGNLIVGYDEVYPAGSGDADERGGSHNLVIGEGHQFSSFGGFVAGLSNRISGISASVLGGVANEATGWYSCVVAGEYNNATNTLTAILGGAENTASEPGSVVCGGYENVASGNYSAVLGGQENEASGSNSTVGGGWMNTASGSQSAVLGGKENTASGANAWEGGCGYVCDE